MNALLKRKSLINFPIVLKVIGQIMMVEAGAMLVAAVACIIYGEATLTGMLLAALITGFPGVLLALVFRKSDTGIMAREGLLITSLAWLTVALFGTLPFLLTAKGVSITNAAFESMSGFTTTGASAIMDVEALGKGLNLWRALMHWIGGIGIILLVIVFVPMLNQSGGIRLIMSEASGYSLDKTSPRVSNTALNLSIVYLVLTVANLIFLWVGPMDFYDSLVHALSTVSTGGFSCYNDGICHFNTLYTKLVLIFFMFAGGVNFTLMVWAGKGDWRQLLCNQTFRTYSAVIVIMLGLFITAFAINAWDFGFEQSVVNPLFTIVSTITSTGFTVADLENWGPMVLVLIFMMMYSGACSGSTTGGAKIDRLVNIAKLGRNEIESTVKTHTFHSVKEDGRAIDRSVLLRISAFLGIYATLVVMGGLALTAMRIPVVDAFFATLSCTSNIGLGYGITGAGGSYALLPEAARWLLIVLMYIGRLEVFTVLAVLLPAFWRR